MVSLLRFFPPGCNEVIVALWAQRKTVLLKVGEHAEVKVKNGLEVPKEVHQAVVLDQEKVCPGGSQWLLPPNTLKSNGRWSTWRFARSLVLVRTVKSSPGSGSGSGSGRQGRTLDEDEAVDDLGGVLDLDLSLLQTPLGESTVVPPTNHRFAKMQRRCQHTQPRKISSK